MENNKDINLKTLKTMNQEFKQKQSAVISILDDYAAMLTAMVGDNAEIEKVANRAKDMAKAFAQLESIFDKFENVDSSYGLETFISQDEYMRWLIGRLDADRTNNDLVKIVETTLNHLMLVMMCEISTCSSVKSKGLICGLEELINK